MNKKNRAGFWLSISMVAAVTILVVTAFNHLDFSSVDAQGIKPSDPFNLKFEQNCVDCHVFSLPDVTFYCHDVLPTESYNNRRYLEVHLYWITTTLTMPEALYWPVVSELPNDEVQVHLFGTRVLPATAEISAGTRVTWTNLDIRPVVLQAGASTDGGPFEYTILAPGESISYTFEHPVTFTYDFQYVNSASSNMVLNIGGVGRVTVSP